MCRVDDSSSPDLRLSPRRLPSAPVLRLMALPLTAREARENLEALDADPTVLQSDKDALWTGFGGQSLG